MSNNKFYITTPIYYVNAKPHIGHTYTSVAADCLARFHRLIGDEVFFLTGTDEHGAKIEEKAREAGMEPKIFVDGIAAQFKEAWQLMNISNDNFIRTTDESHKAAIQKALTFMHEKGDIYLGEYKGLYCRGCEQFKSEKDLVDGRCPDHKTVPEEMSEKTYMFKMSKYADEILARIESGEFEILPMERRNEILSFYKNEGLNDVSFSRENVKWGIPVPWDESQTVYVWADAFLNYLTGLGWDGAANGGHSKFWPADVHFMSRDIIRVHATIWPAMLLSLGLELPKKIFSHGFFMIDGQKMSKSLGNVISPQDLVARYGVDASRYLLLAAVPFGNDGDIGYAKFDEMYNAHLANGIGNLAARVSNLLETNGIETELAEVEISDFKEYAAAIERLSFDEALKIVNAMVSAADMRLTETKPWKMTEKSDVAGVLVPIAQNILSIGYLLRPFMPEAAEKIIKAFSEKQIRKIEPLFLRLVK